MSDSNISRAPMSAQEFTDSLVRVGLVAAMVVLSLRVFSPFMNLMMWALILAVTMYPMHQKLAAKMGGSQGKAATLIVVLGLLLVGGPIVQLGGSAAQAGASLHTAYEEGTLSLPEPQEKVAEWPLIGEKAYAAWEAAADNLPQFVADNRATFESMAAGALAKAKSTAGTVAMLLGALIVAGIMMAYGQSGSEAMRAIFSRVAGPGSGPDVHTLATQTTRSVAVGVLGVAIIQGILMGVCFMLAGVPAAGILALIVTFLAIMQLPATLVGIPVIIWVWNGGDSGTVMNTVWTVVILVAGLADNVLKPMLLGRGVDAPMPIILIGALGGMISAGFIGLFTGAVILAVGYQIFMRWVHNQNVEELDAGAAEPVE